MLTILQYISLIYSVQNMYFSLFLLMCLSGLQGIFTDNGSVGYMKDDDGPEKLQRELLKEKV